MNFVTFQFKEEGIGLLSKDQTKIILLQEAEKKYLGTSTLPNNMQELIEQNNKAIATIEKILTKLDDKCPMISSNDAHILAPIPRPKKNIFCVGKNYVEHALEFEKTKNVNLAVPKVPVIFTKPPTAVTAPNSVIKNHKPYVTQIDYEAELAVVIGKKATCVVKENAYDYVFGYTMLNDVTARNLQKEHAQWFMGKGPDTFAPLGPYIAHKSKISNPHNLTIQCLVNGEVRQDANTKDMIFDIPTLIETISAVITLEPGDIIATGTPSGVGLGFNPPKLLNAGDVVTVKIENLGELTNTIEK